MTGTFGRRLILASEDLLEQFGTRTADGRAITAEWGAVTPEGWYEPVFTTTDDGTVLLTAEEAAQLRSNLDRIDAGLDALRTALGVSR